MPQIPPAVIEFAEQHNIKNVKKDEIFYIKKRAFNYKNIDEAYHGISTPLVTFEKRQDRMYTYCTYILVENGEIRLASPKETEELNQVFCM